MIRLVLIPLLVCIAALRPAPCFAQLNAGLSPDSIPDAKWAVYKTTKQAALRAHVFEPPLTSSTLPRPAVIFFFGGGWRQGTVHQFVPHARHFAALGMVTVVAEYRVKSRHNVSPFECVADARSAMRWLRSNAQKLNIDPQRIVAAGGSAGGHLAASTALLKGVDEPDEDLTVSCEPNALVLFNPVVDMVEFFQERQVTDEWPGKAEEISPIHHMRPGLPPTLIFHGTADTTVPIEQVIRFSEGMKENGNACELVTFEGRQHAFFNATKDDGVDYRTTLEKMEVFLKAKGFLPGVQDKK